MKKECKHAQEKYELGAEKLKELIEETEESKKAKAKAKVLRLSLRLVEVENPAKPRIEFDITESTCAEMFQIPADFSDGSRYIVMNNEDTIVYAYYSCIVSFQMYDEYHLNLEKILFEKMREMLGFKRRF